MLWTKIKRVTKSGFVGFWRNGYLSFSAIVVLTISLLVFGNLIFFNTVSSTYLDQIKEKVDVNVYFSLQASETDIFALKSALEALPEVSRVEYISRAEVLDRFRSRHADDALTLQGLEEIGSNPFPAELNIKAKEPSQYESVSKFLESKNALGSNGKNIVDSVNYTKNKIIIDRLSKITDTTQKMGLFSSLILAFIAIIITFNTIRLIIYSSKDEIAVMKLVGASNRYIRGPFVVSGIMCGIISAIISLLILYPITYYAGKILLSIAGGEAQSNVLLSYYVSNFGQMFGILMLSGIILGAVSSYLAVRRYLDV